MANVSESIERIAADILIAVVSNAHSSDAHDFAKNPEKIAKQYQVIHEAVLAAKTGKSS